jgi:hypothetical protein
MKNLIINNRNHLYVSKEDIEQYVKAKDDASSWIYVQAPVGSQLCLDEPNRISCTSLSLLQSDPTKSKKRKVGDPIKCCIISEKSLKHIDPVSHDAYVYSLLDDEGISDLY